MKVKLSLILMIAVLASGAAFAQTGVAGKWVGELSAADGHGIPQPITVDLKVEGETLSGSVTEGALEARPIAGASITGPNITFRTTRNLGGSDINVNWKGELKAEDLILTREIGPAPAEAGGGRGGGRGGGGGGGGGAAPAAGARGARGAAAPAGAPVPPVPAPQAGAEQQPNANAAGGRGGARGAATGAPAAGGQRGGGRGGAAPAAGGGAAAAGGRGAGPGAAPGPTVTLTLHRSR